MPLSKEGDSGPGRRPLLATFEGNNRQILQGIRDNLSHVLNKNQPPPSNTQNKNDMQIKASGPAKVDGVPAAGAGIQAGTPGQPTSSSRQPKGLEYNQKAMATIRQELKGYHITEPANGGINPASVIKNGYDVDMLPVNEQFVRSLVNMGYDEEVASRAIKLSGNKGVEEALQLMARLHHDNGKNGFNKMSPGLNAYQYGGKVIRKPSFEEKYRTNSPVNSENSSIRSDSPLLQARQVGQAAAGSPLYPPSAVNQLYPVSYANNGQGFSGNQRPNVRISMQMPNERQTPPPLPPRGMPPGGSGRGQSPPPIPQEPYERGYQPLVGSQQAQQSQNSAAQNQQIVCDLIRQRNIQIPNNMRPQTIPGHNMRNGPIAAQRGISPTMGQSVPPGTNMHQQLLQQGPGSENITAIPQPASNFSQMNYAHQSQYASRGLASPTNRIQINGYEQMVLPFGQGDDGSPLSSHSPSPAPTPVNQAYAAGYQPSPQTPVPHLQPVTAWPCKNPQIVTQKVQSHEVTKPVLQTATAPLSPPIQPRAQTTDQEKHNPPELKPRGLEQPLNYVSSVQAEVNQRNPKYTPQQLYQLQQQQHQAQFGYLKQAQRTHSPVEQGNIANLAHPTHPTRGNVQIEIGSRYGKGQVQGTPPQYQGHSPTGTAAGHQAPGRTIQINIQNQQGGQTGVHIQHNVGYSAFNNTPMSTPRSESPVPRALNQSPAMSVISTTSTPSTNSDIPDKPPPPYPGRGASSQQVLPQGQYYYGPLPGQMRFVPEEQSEMQSESPSGSESVVSTDRDDDTSSVSSEKPPLQKLSKKVVRVMSPRPDRKPEARRRDTERRETQVQHFSPQAYKFFMEQHVENILKSHQQREKRRLQLETEMAKVGLSDEAAAQMRKMLHQKESNYIRLKRAKMDRSMFEKIKTLGIGAFGEVALVRKIDTQILYAMKTLRKRDVLRRNQVAHVKAERDILAEAECEWVVKLYYSFQDGNNLYFVMDYIPGGDMMSLLIKYGIFPEELAQFYIAELVLAIESVHNMGFIHRDIKPDNILIDKDGHIKLTDFGLCTGFRWTHNSKYYQKGNHLRQDSMEPDESWFKDNCHCDKDLQKPLVRRNIRHQRCLAHSLVGTPNYIAPEVLLKSGYTRVCDWWSVGVILYEMLVGQPPFLANLPSETQYKVINWRETLRIPQEAKMSSVAENLIIRLLCGPEERLGQQGAKEIKEHAFFQNVNFKDLRLQPAPYKPQIRYPTDTSNFDPVDPEKLKQSSNEDTLKRDSTLENGKHPEHAFLEFTFRRFFDEGGHVYAPRNTDMDESNAPVYV